MSKKDMKLRIDIDGDTKSFQNSLRQAGRDADQFKNKVQNGGLGLGDLTALMAGTKLLEGVRRSTLRGGARVFGTNPTGLHGAEPGRGGKFGFGAQAFLGTLLGNPKMFEHKINAHKTLSALKEKQSLGMSLDSEEFKRGKQAQGTMMGARAGTFVRSIGILTPAIAAAAAAAVIKLGGSGKEILKASTQYSPMMSKLNAEKELRQIKYEMSLAKNPFFMNQQKRLLESEERRKYQDAAGLGYVATEGQIYFNDFLTWLKSLASEATGADSITENGVVY